MVDNTNALQAYWKDSNSSMELRRIPPFNGPSVSISQPILSDFMTNEHQVDAVPIPNVHPSTSMGFTNYLLCRLEDYTIHGYNLSYQAENTTFAPAFGGDSGQYDEFIVAEGGQNVLAVPGTHLSNTALVDVSGPNLKIFLQTIGNDITIFNRADTSAGSAWTSTSANVNQ